MDPLTLAAWLHDLDPYALQFGEGWGIRWYGLSYAAGFLIAWLLVRRAARVGDSPLHPSEAGDLVVTLAVGVIVGGRLGYVLFYQPSLFLSFSDALPYWDALAINRGGMASHGGMLGGIVASYLFARRRRIPWGHVMDLAAFGTPIGLCLGRLANFVNGELVGRGPTDAPWAVRFPQDMYNWDAARFAALRGRLLESGLAPTGMYQYTDRQLASWVIDRIQQDSARIGELVAPLLIARHPSQLYAAVTEGLVVFAALLWAWRRPRKPWTIASLFCIVYALMRIGNEFFRAPDTHLVDREFAAIGITRGQWLSIILLIAGVGVLVFAQRRHRPRLGGWRVPAPESGGSR